MEEIKSWKDSVRAENNSVYLLYTPIIIAVCLLIIGSYFIVQSIYYKLIVPVTIIGFLWTFIILFLFLGVILIFSSINTILSALIVSPYFNKNSNNADTAILFVERQRIFNLVQFYWSGVFWLFLWLRKTNYKYNTYLVYSKEHLEQILLDKKFKILYIFGHGRQYGVDLPENKIYRYKNLEGKIKNRDKEFIAQLHCNSEKWKKSQDITLSKFTKKKYITKGNVYSLQIWYYLFKTWKERHIVSN